MTESKERQQAIEHLGRLIADIPVAMLTTCAADHTLHSRPMVNVNAKFQGDLWFFSHVDDPKIEEIRSNPQVNVAFAAPDQKRYVSVTGTGTSEQDVKRCEVLWTPECKKWFPDGPNDEKLALIRVEVERAEFWDAAQNAMVRVAGFFKSLGGSDAASDVKHDKLNWQS